MKIKARIKMLSLLLVFVCLFASFFMCLYKSTARCFSLRDEVMMLSAFSVMPNGSFYKSADVKEEKVQKPKNTATVTTQKEEAVQNTVRTNENKYRISELNISQGNMSYDNFSVKNSTYYDMDIENLLSQPLDFELKDTRQVQVLIVHTHTCESYMDSDDGYYYESFYPRSTDNEKNVVAVGKAISNSLKARGIGVVNAIEQHDNPSYDGAYGRSYDTIMKYIDRYKEIKVVLDIHRDSMTADDMTKLKPTFTHNGKKAAQIMIMSGHDDSNENFPFWEENLKFALRLQQCCEKMYPGMTRPLYFGDFTYNMNVNSGSLLIEVGTDANTLEEAVRSGEMLGNALSQVLQK